MDINLQTLADHGCEKISDVIDVKVRNPLFMKAVDYFTQGKVVCPDF